MNITFKQEKISAPDYGNMMILMDLVLKNTRLDSKIATKTADRMAAENGLNSVILWSEK